MTNFPTNIDNFTTVTNNTLVENIHPNLHNDVSSAVEALQTKVGVDSSSDINSQDYKVTQNTAHSNINTGNPHNVTSIDIGLGNVDNTSDVDKPISTAQQTALDLKADKSNVLELDNVAVYSPTTDYEPATKKYVDDATSGGGGSSPLLLQTGSISGTFSTTTVSTITHNLGVTQADVQNGKYTIKFSYNLTGSGVNSGRFSENIQSTMAMDSQIRNSGSPTTSNNHFWQTNTTKVYFTPQTMTSSGVVTNLRYYIYQVY